MQEAVNKLSIFCLKKKQAKNNRVGPRKVEERKLKIKTKNKYKRKKRSTKTKLASSKSTVKDKPLSD